MPSGRADSPAKTFTAVAVARPPAGKFLMIMGIWSLGLARTNPKEDHALAGELVW